MINITKDYIDDILNQEYYENRKKYNDKAIKIKFIKIKRKLRKNSKRARKNPIRG